MKTLLKFTLNGQVRELAVDTRAKLAEMIRDDLRLTGTHIGCGTGSCGACTVVLDGVTVKSCCVLAADVQGQDVMTIEGLSPPGELSALQQSFVDHHGLQCGYCTPGMILSAHQLLQDNPRPTEAEIRKAIAGNLCRCTGYQNIVKAIQAASARADSGASSAA
ncbi:MAG: (2Fe-2S)-binding protein [Gammaproteobacteria bacterium]